jgi:hypothetical protein
MSPSVTTCAAYHFVRYIRFMCLMNWNVTRPATLWLIYFPRRCNVTQIMTGVWYFPSRVPIKMRLLSYISIYIVRDREHTGSVIDSQVYTAWPKNHHRFWSHYIFVIFHIYYFFNAMFEIYHGRPCSSGADEMFSSLKAPTPRAMAT